MHVKWQLSSDVVFCDQCGNWYDPKFGHYCPQRSSTQGTSTYESPRGIVVKAPVMKSSQERMVELLERILEILERIANSLDK